VPNLAETPASIRVVGVSLIPTILTTIAALPTTTPAGLTALVNVLPYVFVAVKRKDCRFAEKSASNNTPNSGKAKSYFGYANPEPSREPFGSRACAETIQSASHVDEERVHSSLKNEYKKNPVRCSRLDIRKCLSLYAAMRKANPAKLEKPKALCYGNAKLAEALCFGQV
jgi:hypothetical protein